MKCNEILYPPFVSWEMNTECNHNCIYCYNYKSDTSNICPYDENRIDEVAKFIIEHKPISVSISGGEPLLIYETVRKQIERLVAQGIYVCVYTNGSLVTDEMAAFFAKNNVRLMVSFPSVVQEEFQKIVGNQYTYDSVIECFDILKAYGVNFQPNIVVTSINCDSIRETIEFLYNQYKPNAIFISRTTKPSNAGIEYDEVKLNRQQMNDVYHTCIGLAHQYNIRMRSCGGFALCAFDTDESRKVFGKVCSFGVDGYTITSEGDIRVCAREGQVYGNIFFDDFQTIREAMCEWKSECPPEECVGCRYYDMCRGGCRMAADKGCKSPVKIDCDAKPSLAATWKKKITGQYKFGLFEKFKVSTVSIVQDVTSCRISYLYKYLYVDKKVADVLMRKKEFRFIELCLWCRIGYRNASNLVGRMLNSNIISKAM